MATANLDDYRGIGLYKKLGYIPYNIKDEYNAENWSLSRTLESVSYTHLDVYKRQFQTHIFQENGSAF